MRTLPSECLGTKPRLEDPSVFRWHPLKIFWHTIAAMITVSLGQVLASVCGGDLAGIQSLIENESADQWVRSAALSGLVTLVAAGQKSRDEIVSYFACLFRGKLVRQWSHVWDTLVSYSSDLYAEELLDDIKQAYDEGLVDPGYIGFKHVKQDLALVKDRLFARLADDPHRRLVS